MLRQPAHVLLWMHGTSQSPHHFFLSTFHVRRRRYRDPGLRHAGPLPAQVRTHFGRVCEGRDHVYTEDVSVSAAEVDWKDNGGGVVYRVYNIGVVGRVWSGGEFPTGVCHSTGVLLHQTSSGSRF